MGTQRKSPVGVEIDTSRQFGCTIVEAVWARAPLSNNSAVVSGLLCASHSPRDTYTRHGRHLRVDAGKGSGGTSQTRFFRSVHLLPVPHRTVEGLLGWLDDRLSEQRHRTTPLFLWTPMVGSALIFAVADTVLLTHSAFQLRGPSGAPGGQALEGDHGETGKRSRSSIVCGLLKHSLFDALAHSDVWHLTYSSSARAS